MPTTSVTETAYTDESGKTRIQYRTTVPKQLAEAFDLGGEKIDWEVETGNALRVTKVKQ